MKSKANERRCKCCRKRKPLSEFNPGAWDPINKNAPPEVRICFECQERGPVYNLPDELDVTTLEAKGKYLKKTYDISLKDYEELYVLQFGLCAICHKPAPTEKPFFVVDHDHETGMVRGLLCNSCNVALGLLKDDMNTLRSAVVYLQNSKKLYESKVLRGDT